MKLLYLQISFWKHSSKKCLLCTQTLYKNTVNKHQILICQYVKWIIQQYTMFGINILIQNTIVWSESSEKCLVQILGLFGGKKKYI